MPWGVWGSAAAQPWRCLGLSTQTSLLQAACGEYTGFKSTNALKLAQSEGKSFHGRVAAASSTVSGGRRHRVAQRQPSAACLPRPFPLSYSP